MLAWYWLVLSRLIICDLCHAGCLPCSYRGYAMLGVYHVGAMPCWVYTLSARVMDTHVHAWIIKY